MKEKNKIVTIEGVPFQLGRFNPYVGTHIIMKLIGAVIKAGGESSAVNSPPSDTGTKTISGEDTARTICSAAFLGNIEQDFHEYVERQCMAIICRMEGPNGDIPMPIANSNSLLSDIHDDPALILRLTMEVLAFNYADFFERGGMKALGGT